MNIQVLASQHNQLMTQRNRLLLLVGVSGVLNVLLGLSNFYLIGKERILVVPPVISREFWVATDSVSDSYLEQMSEFFSGLVLNVTPNSFASRSEQLLQHVDPSHYATVKAQMVEQSMEISRRGMSTSFHPASFKIDRKHLKVQVRGELRIFMGSSAMESSTRTYEIHFNHRHGKLYIRQFKEVQHV